MKKKIIIILILVAVAIVGIGRLATRQPGFKPEGVTPVLDPKGVTKPTGEATESKVAEPIAQFRQRITKKFFGTYVMPANSPITPERFKGYHTGIDVEYTEVVDEVVVKTIADGIVVRSGYASGYGGVMVIRHEIKGETWYAVYGHLRPSSLLKTGTPVNRGEQIDRKSVV